jgi:glycosyltransferase involved in cell wall biosynthesis
MNNKLIFIINEYSFYLSHRQELIKRLAKYYDIDIITDLSNIEKHNLEILNTENITFIHLSKRKPGLNPFNIAAFTLALKNYINNHDYVFFVSMENCLIGSVLSKTLKTKNNFFLITGIDSILSPITIREIAIKIFYKISFGFFLDTKNIFIFQNKDDQSQISSLSKKINSMLIEGNGIDLNKYKFKKRLITKEQGIKFLFASKLETAKGINEYFNAALSLKKTYPKSSFSIAGKWEPGNKRSISSDQYEFIIKQDEINYLGEVKYSEMLELLYSHDVLILPSYREGLPSIAIEAAASGMPLIVSNVPGCRSLIGEKKNGYLIEPYSSSSIVKSVKALLRDQKDFSNLSINSRQLIEKRFEIMKITDQYLKLLAKS